MIKIITDSTAYLPDGFAKENGIVVLPLTVTLNGEEFLDDDSSRYEEFYEKVSKSKTAPQSSQPNIALVSEAFQKVVDDGDEAIAFAISHAMSGTANTFSVVKNEIDKNNQITVIDSGTVAQTMYLFIKDAVKLIKEGKSRDEIVEHIHNLQENSVINFIPENLDSLKRGGRIGKINYIVGSVLKIKPVLSFKQNVLSCLKKVIGMKNAVNTIIKAIPQKVREIMVLKIGKSDFFGEFQQQVKKAFPNVPISSGNLGPAVGTHVGKAVGIACLVDKEPA